MSAIQETIARKEQELAMLQTMRRNTAQLLTTLRDFSSDFENLNDNVNGMTLLLTFLLLMRS